jgi:hypothetical protein
MQNSKSCSSLDRQEVEVVDAMHLEDESWTSSPISVTVHLVILELPCE